MYNPALEALKLGLGLKNDRWPAQWAGKFRNSCAIKVGALWASRRWRILGISLQREIGCWGLTPVPDWNSMYWHSKLKLLLMVYVDDFKMSGPIENMRQGWKFIRTSIQTDEPSPPGKCLGCNHVIKEVSVDGNKLRHMIYDMEQFWYSVSKLIWPLRIKPVILSNMQRLHSWTKID